MTFRKNWIAFSTLVRKEILRFLKVWIQTLVPPIINQTLYFVIFGAFIGSQIRNVQGIPYILFIIPGLMMIGLISSSFMNVVSSFYIAKFQRSIEEVLVSPMPNWVTLAGFLVGGVIRGALVGFLIFLIAFVFAHPVVLHPGIVLLFSFLTALVFSLGGFINAVFAKNFDDITLFPTFVLTPLSYFGGVFYSIKDLPPLWQAISKWNPILYMVDGFRYGFYGISDVNLGVSVAILVVLAVVLTAISLRLLNKGIGLRH